MPILAEYTWTEKKDQIKVSVPLKGVSPKKVDILVSTLTLKVNFSPYILDVLLYDEVDSIQHKATVKDGVLHITLYKKQPSFWGQFESEESDLEAIRSKKAASLKARAELDTKLAEQQKDKKIEEERHAVRQQMALEDAERTRLEQTKQQEKETAEKEVYEVLSKLHQNDKNNQFTETKSATSTKKMVSFNQLPESYAKEYNDGDEYDMLEDFEEKQNDDTTSSNIFSVSNERNNDPEEIGGEEMIEEDIKYIPPPRNSMGQNNLSLLSDDKTADISSSNSKVRINFTPRVFPTPMRESKAAEEEDWIAKNRRHLKKHGILSKHLQSSTSSLKKQGSGGGDVSEEDASWLKAKGDDFFRVGDIRSALNAYSAALDADEDFVACYANRASCYLTLQLYEACVEDCVAAIERIQKEMKQAQERDSAIGPCRDTNLGSSCDNNNDTDTSSVATHETQSQRQREDSLEQQRLWSLYVKLLVRRGGAYCHLGQFQLSLADYLQAQVTLTQRATQLTQHLPQITLQSLADDISRLKQLVSVENNKKQADVSYAEGRVAEALIAYDTVLTQFPVYVAALANRAACHMLQQDYEKCVADCDTALSLLNDCSSDSFSKLQRSSMVTVFLPAKGSEKRKQWLLRLHTRKAVALISLERLAEAWEAYEAACKIDPENAALKQDRDALETLIEQRMAQQQLSVSQKDYNSSHSLDLVQTE